MALRNSLSRKYRLVIAVIVFAMIASCVAIAGCKSSESKQKEYRSEWVDTMSALEKRVATDDTKANELAQKNDIIGLMELVDKRVKYVNSTYDQIAELYPPSDLRKLHAVTLFYLTSVVEQLEANEDLYEAIRTGKPTEDLQTIAENAVKRTEAVKQELALEIERARIDLEVPDESKPVENGSSQPSGSAPGNE